MRKIILVAALVGLHFIPGIAPAMATDQSTAVQLCGKNPNCGLTRSQGGVNLWVKTSSGGVNEVWCPDKGPCECISCAPPPAREVPRFGILNLPQVNAAGSLTSSGSPNVESMPAPSSPSSGGGNPPIIF